MVTRTQNVVRDGPHNGTRKFWGLMENALILNPGGGLTSTHSCQNYGTLHFK